MNKKQLKALTERYIFYDDEKNKGLYDERFYGFKIALMELNLIDKVENNVFKARHKRGLQQIEIIEDLINKTKGKNSFRAKLIDDYYEDAKYLGLNEEETRILKANIEYVREYC